MGGADGADDGGVVTTYYNIDSAETGPVHEDPGDGDASKPEESGGDSDNEESGHNVGKHVLY